MRGSSKLRSKPFEELSFTRKLKLRFVCLFVCLYCWVFYFESLQHCRRLLNTPEPTWGGVQVWTFYFEVLCFCLCDKSVKTPLTEKCWLTASYIVRQTRLNPLNNGANSANGWKLKNSSSDVIRTPKLLNIFRHPENGAAEHRATNGSLRYQNSGK